MWKGPGFDTSTAKKQKVNLPASVPGRSPHFSQCLPLAGYSFLRRRGTGTGVTASLGGLPPLSLGISIQMKTQPQQVAEGIVWQPSSFPAALGRVWESEADRHRAAGTFIPFQEVMVQEKDVSLVDTPLKCPHTGQVISKTPSIMAQQSTAQQSLLRGHLRLHSQSMGLSGM